MPTDTNDTLLFSPTNRDRHVIRTIVVCNNTSSSVAYRIFHDEDGTTYSTATALFYDIPQPANSTTAIEFDIYMNDPAGSIAVRSATGSALTFTAYGDEGSE